MLALLQKSFVGTWKELKTANALVTEKISDALSREDFRKRNWAEQARISMRVMSFTEKTFRTFYGSKCCQPHLILFLELKNVPGGTAHLISSKYSKKIKRTVQEETTGSNQADILWIVDDNEVSKSFLWLIQVYSDKNATFLKCNALVAYPAHVLWLNLNARQRRYVTEQGHVLLGILSAGSEIWK